MFIIIIGIFVELLGSTLSNLGAQTQKIAHKKIASAEQQQQQQHNVSLTNSNDIEAESAENSQSQSYYFLHPLWLFGLSLTGLGSVCSLSAVAFAPQTVIAPVSSMTFLINMILTPIMQNERLPRAIIGITLGITCGAILAIIFSPKDIEDPASVEEFMNVYRSIDFFLYAGIVVVILACLWIGAEYYKDTDASIHRFCYFTFCGISGAQNLLMGKGVSKSIVLSFQNKDQDSCLVYWEWYLLSVGLIILSVSYIRWYNQGLRQFSPLQFVAIQTAFWMFTVIIGGLIVFKEMDAFDNILSVVMFTMGICISILFMFSLSGIEPREITPGVFIDSGILSADGDSIELERIM